MRGQGGPSDCNPDSIQDQRRIQNRSTKHKKGKVCSLMGTRREPFRMKNFLSKIILFFLALTAKYELRLTSTYLISIYMNLRIVKGKKCSICGRKIWKTQSGRLFCTGFPYYCSGQSEDQGKDIDCDFTSETQD